MEDSVKIFVAGMKKIARLKKINQATLGKAINKDQTTISNYYTYKTRPNHKSISKLVEALGVTYDEILETGRQELHPPEKFKQLYEMKADIEAIKTKMEKSNNNQTDIEKHIFTKHQQLVQKFPVEQANIAYEINRNLLELAKVKPDDMEEINEVIKLKLRRLPKSMPGEHSTGTDPVK